MSQAQALLLNRFEQGFLYAFLGLGVLLAFRFFRFPDLTARTDDHVGAGYRLLKSGRPNPFSRPI